MGEGRGKEEEGRGNKEDQPQAVARGFKGLVAWQKALELASCVFANVRAKSLPPWLMSQLMSAALSVPSNIAEGYTRGGLKDYLRFLDMARSSLAELESHLYFMVVTGLLEESTYDKIEERASEVGNILVGLMRSLNAKLKDGSWSRLAEDRADYITEAADDRLPPPSFFHLPGKAL